MSNFSVEGFLANIPDVILEDEHLRQLAEVAARVMYKHLQDPRKAAIYCRIDELDEGVLDILAKDLKVDWYDVNADVETKRKQITNNWFVHKRLGTVGSVERALSDLWMDSLIEEWFEYGGDPYHFNVRLTIGQSDESAPTIDEVKQLIRYYKNVRSVLDNVIYSGGNCPITLKSAPAVAGIDLSETCVMY